jgi:hypothetical protein
MVTNHQVRGQQSSNTMFKHHQNTLSTIVKAMVEHRQTTWSNIINTHCQTSYKLHSWLWRMHGYQHQRIWLFVCFVCVQCNAHDHTPGNTHQMSVLRFHSFAMQGIDWTVAGAWIAEEHEGQCIGCMHRHDIYCSGLSFCTHLTLISLSSHSRLNRISLSSHSHVTHTNLNSL